MKLNSNHFLLGILGVMVLALNHVSYLTLFEYPFILIASSIWGGATLICFTIIYLNLSNERMKQ